MGNNSEVCFDCIDFDANGDYIYTGGESTYNTLMYKAILLTSDVTGILSLLKYSI